MAGGEPVVPGVDGAGVDGVVVVSFVEGAAGAGAGAGAAAGGVSGALLASLELSLQAASPKNETAATEAIKNFFMMAILP